MTVQKPRITLLNPVVLKDNRRVILELVVEDLPVDFANIMFMPDVTTPPPTRPPKPDPDAPSPYPNVELSILNSHRRQVASLFIVEHKEKNIALTLHLRSPDLSEQYTARAEMTHNDEIIEVIEVPFTLNQAN